MLPSNFCLPGYTTSPVRLCDTYSILPDSLNEDIVIRPYAVRGNELMTMMIFDPSRARSDNPSML